MRFKKAVSRAGSILIVFIFCFSLFVFITVLSHWGSGVPNFYGYSFLSVRTPSMEPTYKVGSIVITKRIDSNQLKPGDVISFYSDDPDIYGTPNTHRIVSVGVDNVDQVYYVTKGDNNPVPDKYRVYPDKVIGRVQGSIASAGNIIGKLKNRVVLFFLLIVPLSIIILIEIKNIKKILKSKEEEPGAEDKNKASDLTAAQKEPNEDLLEKINNIQSEIDMLQTKTSKEEKRK